MQSPVRRAEFLEPQLSPPRTPVKLPRPEPECPPAPKRMCFTKVTIKSGDLHRFKLNLEHCENNSIDDWESAVDNMYYICEFTLASEENEGADVKDIKNLQDAVLGIRGQLEYIQDALENEDSQVNVPWIEFNLRTENLIYIRDKLKYLEDHAIIVPSS